MFTRKEDTDLCPFFQSQCKKERCRMWRPQLAILDPQNPTKTQEVYDCDVHWIAHLTRDVAAQQNATSIALETMRNENIKNMQLIAMTMADVFKRALQEMTAQRKLEDKP